MNFNHPKLIKSGSLCVLLAIFLSSCTQGQQEKQKPVKADPLPNQKEAALSKTDSVPAEELYADYDVVVADTGLNYNTLRSKLFQVHAQLGLPIDTLGRTFYPKKNLIALPEDDEDEIYAGDYFPRRIPGAHLSLEYLSIYKRHSNGHMMALVSGIYENRKSADSALILLKSAAPKAFVLRSRLYIGCLH
ncbi:MAG: hypothetical protein REI78_12745 [Pedobacter sp.]|nr:hypothetical protein [Pedobacter sp.]MDQ8053894.1 hypothetical protein [Pedobacter sp.]